PLDDERLQMIGESLPGTRRITVAGDKGFDTRSCRRPTARDRTYQIKLQRFIRVQITHDRALLRFLDDPRFPPASRLAVIACPRARAYLLAGASAEAGEPTTPRRLPSPNVVGGFPVRMRTRSATLASQICTPGQRPASPNPRVPARSSAGPFS